MWGDLAQVLAATPELFVMGITVWGISARSSKGTSDVPSLIAMAFVGGFMPGFVLIIREYSNIIQ